jgi:hypothetical protein
MACTPLIWGLVDIVIYRPTMTTNTKSAFRAAIHDLVELERITMLSKEGKNWLIQALDPFHDTDIPTTGFPDANIGGSIVQEVKLSIQMSAPSTITSGTWDLHMFNASNLTPGTTYQGSFEAGFTASATEVSNTVGGVVIITGPTGSQLNLTGYPNTAYVNQLSLPVDYLTGSSRIVAMGFEGVNTTSDLYRQGLVTVYRQPQPTTQVVNYPLTIGTTASNTNMLLLNDAPTSIDQAMLLEGSRQWKAADGSYSVVTFSSVDCPARQLSNASGVYLSDTLDVTKATPCALVEPSGDGTSYYLDNHNLNMSGAYYTGLSLQTTITVNVVYYVERFPSCFNATLAVLTSPSVPYDPTALELYARAMTGMPPGVPQNENCMGEWFSDVIESIKPAFLGRRMLWSVGMGSEGVGNRGGNVVRSRVSRGRGNVPPGQAYSPDVSTEGAMPARRRRSRRRRRKAEPKNM